MGPASEVSRGGRRGERRGQGREGGGGGRQDGPSLYLIEGAERDIYTCAFSCNLPVDSSAMDPLLWNLCYQRALCLLWNLLSSAAVDPLLYICGWLAHGPQS